MTTNTAEKKTAKFVADSDKFRGPAKLYKLDPPQFGDVEYAVLVHTPAHPEGSFGALLTEALGRENQDETFFIPTDASGDDGSDEAEALNFGHGEDLLDMIEPGYVEHETFLAKLGYEVEA